jgi:hypothetical protein
VNVAESPDANTAVRLNASMSNGSTVCGNRPDTIPQFLARQAICRALSFEAGCAERSLGIAASID